MAMVPRELTTELADGLQNSCVVSCACVSLAGDSETWLAVTV